MLNNYHRRHHKAKVAPAKADLAVPAKAAQAKAGLAVNVDQADQADRVGQVDNRTAQRARQATSKQPSSMCSRSLARSALSPRLATVGKLAVESFNGEPTATEQLAVSERGYGRLAPLATG